MTAAYENADHDVTEYWMLEISYFYQPVVWARGEGYVPTGERKLFKQTRGPYQSLKSAKNAYTQLSRNHSFSNMHAKYFKTVVEWEEQDVSE
jgi:hypothetical protein